VTCERVRLALSARIDGEDPGVAETVVAVHLAGCGACRRFAAEAETLHRSLRLRSADAVPDLSAPIMASIDGERARLQDSRRWALRMALVAVGVVQLAAALPALVLGDDAGLPVHAARHIGSFDAALAVGFLVAAWRPARIAGLLPVLVVLVACLLGGAAVDVLSGQVPAPGEALHLVVLVGLAAAWVLARMSAPPPTTFRTTELVTP
jgi:predicted anti-sigma-YlaC factor YlaD